MNRMPKTIVMLGLVLVLPAAADTVYRSFDADGNPIFSDRAPPEGGPAEPVALPQGPSDESIQRAQERLRETEARADELTRQRHERERLRLESRPPTIIYPDPPPAQTYGYPVYPRHRPYRPPYYRPHPRPPGLDDDHPAFWPPGGPVRPTPLPTPPPNPPSGRANR